jgi:hypothetical protein
MESLAIEVSTLEIGNEPWSQFVCHEKRFLRSFNMNRKAFDLVTSLMWLCQLPTYRLNTNYESTK